MNNNHDNNGRTVGFPYAEWVIGRISATVWANRTPTGELYFKFTFREKELRANGRYAYHNSFSPEVIGELYEAAKTVWRWYSEEGHALERASRPSTTKKGKAGAKPKPASGGKA